MKCLITLQSGLSVEQNIELSYEEILKIYGVNQPLLREDGTVYDVIAKVEFVVERSGSPTIYIDSSEYVNEQIVTEICELDEPLTWNSEKFRYTAADISLSNGLVCRITEMPNDIAEIHVMVLTEKEAADAEHEASLQYARLERFTNMNINGLVDVVKANYLKFLGTIYGYVQKDESEEMSKYVKAVQELIPTTLLITKEPFTVYCAAQDGVLKIILREMENGQLGIEFMKKKTEE